ncbi:MAG TPA: PilZ domain-containing protein [Vicinamibacteria bacterium]|jgi:Tfp pilus assembly protein PilZ
MKTVLDLIAEFGALNDAKMRTGSNLSPGDDGRWAELKTFYELSMHQDGLDLDRKTPPITAADIRKRLHDRERIRVPTDAPVVFQHAGEHFTGGVVNLSRSGLFLASERLFEIGACLEICLSQIDRDTEGLFEVQGEVAWLTKHGVAELDLPRGMGIHFVDPPQSVVEKLDSYVVESIARHLSRLW